MRNRCKIKEGIGRMAVEEDDTLEICILNICIKRMSKIRLHLICFLNLLKVLIILVESAREVCGSVRVGGKEPKECVVE